MEPIAHFQLDSDTNVTPIYKGMRVMITQNRDKARNIVNGQMAIVQMCQNSTVLLKLPEGSLIVTYPVTFQSPTGTRTCHPFHLAYANTMCKAQGQTLEKTIL